MDIHRSDLPHCAELEGAVVVIDVLRSFTTAAVALARGARGVWAVGTLDEALERSLELLPRMASGRMQDAMTWLHTPPKKEIEIPVEGAKLAPPKTTKDPK